MRYLFIFLAVCITTLQMSGVTTAQTVTREKSVGDKAGALKGKSLESDTGNICISWTKARESACKEATEKIKKICPDCIKDPFGVIEKKQGESQLQFRIAFKGDTPKQGEKGFNCVKGTVQEGFRRSSVDFLSIDDMISQSQKLTTQERIDQISKDPERKDEADPGKVKGKSQCYDDGEVEKTVGKGCGQGDGKKGPQDPQTCITGVICTQQSPLSDAVKQKIKGAGIKCFKEKSQASVTKDKKKFTKGVSFSTVCYCSDDAKKMTQVTQQDAEQNENKANDSIDKQTVDPNASQRILKTPAQKK